jgi:hypothetical protein
MKCSRNTPAEALVDEHENDGVGALVSIRAQYQGEPQRGPFVNTLKPLCQALSSGVMARMTSLTILKISLELSLSYTNWAGITLMMRKLISCSRASNAPNNMLSLSW